MLSPAAFDCRTHRADTARARQQELPRPHASFGTSRFLAIHPRRQCSTPDRFATSSACRLRETGGHPLPSPDDAAAVAFVWRAWHDEQLTSRNSCATVLVPARRPAASGSSGGLHARDRSRNGRARAVSRRIGCTRSLKTHSPIQAGRKHHKHHHEIKNTGRSLRKHCIPSRQNSASRGLRQPPDRLVGDTRGRPPLLRAFPLPATEPLIAPHRRSSNSPCRHSCPPWRLF
jgi:hypothetical protein